MNLVDVFKTPMTDFNYDLAVAQAIALIKSYSFDTNGITVENLVQKWLSNYQRNWVRLAAIEALYLGRYKTISMEQIMEVWLRIGTPNVHFTGEFERLICRQLPKHLVISDSSWSKQEESLLFSSLNETANSEALSHKDPKDLFTSQSFPQEEISFPYNNSSKTLSEVKKAFKQVRGRGDGEIRGQGDREIGSPKGLAPLRSASRGDREIGGQDECLASDSSLYLSEDKPQPSDNYHLPSHSPNITNFHPIVDDSSFFDKLKSLAFNSDRLN